MDEIRALAEPLAGRRVLHLSATAFGGGVAEINYTLVPLMQDAGLEVEWRIIRGADDFFNVTKTIHNALQGAPRSLSDEEKEIFRRYNVGNAEALTDSFDYVIVHDPQPAGMIDHARACGRHWIWRCHIDLSTPNPDTLARILPLVQRYEATVWHMEAYVPDAISEGVRIVPPAIDPLSPKNMRLSP